MSKVNITTQLFDRLPKLRLVLSVNRIPSVNEMYDYYRGRVVKSTATRVFQEEIARQISKTVDLKKYPWINNRNRYQTDYKFVIRNSFNARDTTNMIKATEDAIHRVLGTDDNRVIRATAQKFDNAEMIKELVIFTIMPYVDSVSIRDTGKSEEETILSSNVTMCNRYKEQIDKIKSRFNITSIPTDSTIDLGFIALKTLEEDIVIDDLVSFLRTLKFIRLNLKVVNPKRSEWIKMISPSGEVCEMYNEEINDRYKEGFTFGKYNYIFEGD